MYTHPYIQGISLVGVLKGDGHTPGTPKLTELPSYNSFMGNEIVGCPQAAIYLRNTRNTSCEPQSQCTVQPPPG